MQDRNFQRLATEFAAVIEFFSRIGRGALRRFLFERHHHHGVALHFGKWPDFKLDIHVVPF